MKRILVLAILAILFSANAFAQNPPIVSVTIQTVPWPATSYATGPISIYVTGITVNSNPPPPSTQITVSYYALNTSPSICTSPPDCPTIYIGSSTTSTGSYPYQVSWTPPAGNYSIYAIAAVATSGNGNSIPNSSGSTNGKIDMVEDEADFPANTPNPVSSTAFEELNPNPSAAPVTTSWVEGDNQFCSANDSSGFPQWPYNGRSAAYPDGSCEWTNSVTNSSAPTYTTPTIDMVDDTMHTLSDFDNFANSLLNLDMGTIDKTFSTWYPQAATWIAPGCSTSCSGTDLAASCASSDVTCNQHDASSTGNGRLLDIYEPGAQGTSSGYPGLPSPYNASNYTGTTVDALKSWNNLIIPWLNNSYANTGAWCVPPETTLESETDNSGCPNGGACPVNGLCADGVTKCLPNSELSYIIDNSYSNSYTTSPTNWGDLAHVISCLSFNAGPTQAQQSSTQYSNYQTCLGELPSGRSCPATLPPDCPPYFDPTHGGCNIAQAGSYANWLSSFPNQSSNSIYQQCLTALTSGLPSCPASLPPQCAVFGSPPKAWSSTDSNRCNIYALGSYANWASNSFNFGPIYNYNNCLNLLNTACPSDANPSTALTGTVCDPEILGRSLEPGITTPACTADSDCTLTGNCSNGQCIAPVFSGAQRCVSTYTNSKGQISFAHWVQDNITLFTDVQPKFQARSAYLSDIYSRAQTMQNIFTQGDIALHSFLKPCGQCAYTTACPYGGVCPDNVTPCGPPGCKDLSTCTNGQCQDGTPCQPAGQCAMTSMCPASNECFDGSACGAPLCKDGHPCGSNGLCSDGVTTCNYCGNGGPAAQLIYLHAVGDPRDSLPNSVIYGWVDNIPTGRIGGCTDANGNPAGCAHIVKVTAYSPARIGNTSTDSNGNNTSIIGLQPNLPNIQTMMTTFTRQYYLQDRDGTVFLSVKRWDQNHSNPVSFPNGHMLWQSMFQNPTQSVPSGLGNGLPSQCLNAPYQCTSGPCFNAGYGLLQQTIDGLNFQNISSQDKLALNQAFMLNDNGNGLVDPVANNSTSPVSCVAGGGTSSTGGAPNPYCACLDAANKLLDTGTKSYSCARYVASLAGEDPSNTGSGDYSLKFVDCNQYDNGNPPEDLKY